MLFDTKEILDGDVKIIQNFLMPELKTKRRVWVYLPPDYETSNKKYPVIYMQDGQNLFDPHTSYAGDWGVNGTLERLFKDGRTKGVIVVGVDNAGKNRMREYNPWPELGGRGDQFANFIVNTLKPYIDSNYKTLSDRANTGIMGSSMGAYIALYIAIKHKNVFSKVGLLSPAFWLYKEQIMEFISNSQILDDTKIYFYVGTNEGDEERSRQYIEETKRAYDIIKTKINPDNNTTLDIMNGGTHSEKVWKQKFEQAFLWLY